jgi:hypothetical protein
MTTQLPKEEVLRLAKEAGFIIDNDDVMLLCVDFLKNEYLYSAYEEVTKLIEIVRKEAIATERDRIAKLYIEEISGESRDGDQFYDLVPCGFVEAIRGRE